MPLLFGALSAACQAPHAVWGGMWRGMRGAGCRVCGGTWRTNAFGFRKRAVCPCHSSGKGQGWQGRQRHEVALASGAQMPNALCNLRLAELTWNHWP